MFKNDHKNPLSNVFQYEYALYLLVSDLFYDVQCSSVFALETLHLYYMDLVTTNRSGKASYEKQLRVESRISSWIKRDVSGRIVFPMIDECRAKATIEQCPDGTHRFVFDDGIYAFSVKLRQDEKRKKIIGIDVANMNSHNAAD